jgi:hypothetical protein
LGLAPPLEHHAVVIVKEVTGIETQTEEDWEEIYTVSYNGLQRETKFERLAFTQ